MLSIIIPTFNEDSVLRRTLAAARSSAPDCEIIVADGGSSDATEEAAAEFGAVFAAAEKGRGRQLNYGAASAAGDLLLFLHADTILPAGFDKLIEAACSSPEVVGGAFSLAFDEPGRAMRVVAWGANLRSRYLALPYGDQAIFTRRTSFDALNGFCELPILEDVDFIRRLSTQGELRILNEKVVTSSRRWQSQGVVRTTFVNQLIMAGYYLGIAPEKLKMLYR